jgi:hypothetical protein
VIICEIIVHLLVIVQNKKYTRVLEAFAAFMLSVVQVGIYV